LLAITAPPKETLPIVVAYYPDWGASSLSPEEVDFGRLDWIDFGSGNHHLSYVPVSSLQKAFAVPDNTFTPQLSDSNSQQLLTRLVSHAHANNKFVKLSIGGWDGSKFVSSFALEQS
jgi:chitinase